MTFCFAMHVECYVISIAVIKIILAIAKNMRPGNWKLARLVTEVFAKERVVLIGSG